MQQTQIWPEPFIVQTWIIYSNRVHRLKYERYTKQGLENSFPFLPNDYVFIELIEHDHIFDFKIIKITFLTQKMFCTICKIKCSLFFSRLNNISDQFFIHQG